MLFDAFTNRFYLLFPVNYFFAASRSFIFGLRREILRLRNFRVKQVEQAEENGSLDKAVVLDCNLG